MKHKIPIKELIDRCVVMMREMHYSDFCISNYQSIWRGGICRYMQNNEIYDYCQPIGEEFLSSLPERKIHARNFPLLFRSIRILNSVLDNNEIPGRSDRKLAFKMDGRFAEGANLLFDHLKSLQRSKATIRRYEVIVSRLLAYLNHEGINSIEEISEDNLTAFVAIQDTSSAETVSVVKCLMKFWFDRGLIGQDLSVSLSAYRTSHHQRILSFYDKDEISIIEKSVDRSNALGKRNYALLLLSTRLGLRASDIANLKLSDIDWKNNEIRIIQVKTGEPASFPLLSVVGNAMIDYLKYGRQSFISSPNVFHSMRPPYHAMSSSMVSAAVTSVIEQCGVELNGRRHGPHAMRHSLATNMLRQQVTLPVISEALGHKSTKATTVYLSVNIPSLMACSNDVPPVPFEFYKAINE